MKRIQANECPHCGKKHLIQYRSDFDQHFICDFKKGISSLDVGKIILSFFAVIIMALLTKYSYGEIRDESFNRASDLQQITSTIN